MSLENWKWWCPKCGGRVEYCGTRNNQHSGGLYPKDILFTHLMWCRNCNANIEFTELKD
jgi:hypothetical protein